MYRVCNQTEIHIASTFSERVDSSMADVIPFMGCSTLYGYF